ncbi:hypothetical protein [Acidovorax sp. SUPP2539]|nr:hypothetical protein [Acidovorax sp. SUPP2539]GKS88185.1 hypothetical protein AVTE2539_02490 [Acidovorax sp. SUPP2539]
MQNLEGKMAIFLLIVLMAGAIGAGFFEEAKGYGAALEVKESRRA